MSFQPWRFLKRESVVRRCTCHFRVSGDPGERFGSAAQNDRPTLHELRILTDRTVPVNSTPNSASCSNCRRSPSADSRAFVPTLPRVSKRRRRRNATWNGLRSASGELQRPLLSLPVSLPRRPLAWISAPPGGARRNEIPAVLLFLASPLRL